MTMNIFIEGSPKEIAALALELQGRLVEKVDFGDGTLPREMLSRILRPGVATKRDTPAEDRREEVR